MSKPHRILAVLNSPKHVPDKIKLSRNVVQSIRSNASQFPGLTPSVNQLEQEVNELDAAETAAKSKTRGTVEKRNVCLGKVDSSLAFLKAGVQQVADANPEEAEAIIQSAGMGVRRPTSRTKPDFDIQHGEVSGSVVISVRAHPGRSAYEWQTSTDQKSWINLPTTVVSKTSVHNLTPGLSYAFRYRVVTHDGEGEWSQVVTILVT